MRKQAARRNVKTKLIKQFLGQLERHYSHYSPTSETEYVDCASSCLKLWGGPTQGEQCFIEWFDSIKADDLPEGFTVGMQGSFAYYNSRNWFPGVNDGRPKPSSIGAGAPKVPVSYSQFLKVCSHFDLKYKDLTPDQCVACNKLNAAVDDASDSDDEKEAEKAKTAHLAEADFAYQLRTALRVDCAAAWAALPPPPANPTPQSRKCADHVQMDYGGGLRTPWVQTGPAYFLRTLPSKPYYICSSTGTTYVNWSNCTISEAGGDDICSITYRYLTEHATGCEDMIYYTDGTYGQCNNTCFWMFCVDQCNPESNTFVDEEGKALFRSVNVSRGPVGHTYMLADAFHGKVGKNGRKTGQVASTEEWAKSASQLMHDGVPFTSELAQQPHFSMWGAYLRQMYVPRKQDIEGRTLRFHQDYRFINFGFGRLPDGPDGQEIWHHHPYEVWLRKGDNPSEPLHNEKPVRVCYGRHMKPNGTMHAKQETFWEWYRRTQEKAGFNDQTLPLSDFGKYDDPLPITFEKQWDLFKLAGHLKTSPTLTQGDIDKLYPRPEGEDPSDEEEEEEGTSEEEEEEEEEDDE